MTNQISVENLAPIAYNKIPVITTELLAQLYGTEINNIKVNYTRNSERFVCGKHYFKLEGDQLREFKNKVTQSNLVAPRAKHLILWTERGAARHAKMLETDQAWEVFEKLEDSYFSQREKVASKPQGAKQPTSLDYFRKARAAKMMMEVVNDVCGRFPDLSQESQLALTAHRLNPIIGDNVIPLPVINEHYYSASEVGSQLKISANKVGRIANTYMLKTEQYGKWFIDKSPYSDKQVESFRYNNRGVRKIEEILDAENKAEFGT
ncbi:ORF6N domain-containing protein [Escherichia coli]|uniref:ORF6N domain-containing protein n=1 Tax=Escherichia coli TaxID=562 RepID=UPI00053AA200|nr:ORF6N domain-containing protein [Escherichia coli]HBC0108326.1 ORF6N domain-containing protein [Escherichia coli]HDX3863743.1 ORF6N domain-containing protein [Escherichia coli]HEA6332353.1 ORF6N domain-containing protein [Escherichia coli]HEA8564977.1 ORF6N domain-containing protein [Escherichia coli]HEA8578013.1 ORF6N domain-containing protein [Escherichia coli]